jgi:hypothetical protein
VNIHSKLHVVTVRKNTVWIFTANYTLSRSVRTQCEFSTPSTYQNSNKYLCPDHLCTAVQLYFLLPLTALTKGLLETLLVVHLAKKLLPRNSITVCTKPHFWTLNLATSIQKTSSHPLYWRPALLLTFPSRFGLQSGVFPVSSLPYSLPHKVCLLQRNARTHICKTRNIAECLHVVWCHRRKTFSPSTPPTQQAPFCGPKFRKH